MWNPEATATDLLSFWEIWSKQLVLLRLILNYPGIYLERSNSLVARDKWFRGLLCNVVMSKGPSFMAVLRYNPSMLLWIDESGCDRRNCMRKHGHSLRGMTPKDHHLMVRRTRYSAIPVMSLDGIHDISLAEGNVNGEKFGTFVRSCLLPVHLTTQTHIPLSY